MLVETCWKEGSIHLKHKYFCELMNVFPVTLDQFNAFLWIQILLTQHYFGKLWIICQCAVFFADITSALNSC